MLEKIAGIQKENLEILEKLAKLKDAGIITAKESKKEKENSFKYLVSSSFIYLIIF